MSVPNERAERALTEYENVIQMLVDYQIARGNYRMKRIDIDEAAAGGESISNAERIQLEELRKECDDVRVRLCEQIPIVRDSMLQAIRAMEDADGHEIDMDLYEDLQERMVELPACPSEGDFMNISFVSGAESVDEDIIISSDDDDDDDAEVDANQERVMASVQDVISKAKSLRQLRAKMRDLNEMKRESRVEMFALRDQQRDTSHHQQQQRALFDDMNALRADSRRIQAEIRNIIDEILPQVTDERLSRQLIEILTNVEDEEEQFDMSQPDDGIQRQAPQSKLPQPQSRLPSRLPRAAQSRLPQPTQPRAPQVQSRIPQIQSRIPQRPSRLPQPQSRLLQPPTRSQQLQFHLPQAQVTQQRAIPSQLRPPTAQTQNTQTDIERHKSKISQAANIRQMGSYRNLRRAQELEQQPRVIPRSVVDERMKQHKTVLRLSESIGNVRRVTARPMPRTAFNQTSADVRAQEVKRIHLKNLSTAQRKSLHKQNTIKQMDEVSRKLADAEAIQKRMIAKMPLEKRKEEEKECIDHLLTSMITHFFKEFEPGLEENISHEGKMKFLEGRLKLMFDNIRRTMAQFRGASFIPDEPANNRFMQGVLNHFDSNKDFQNYRQVLTDFFKKMPYPPFRVHKKPAHLQTASKAQRPAARPATAVAPKPSSRMSNLRRPATSTPATVIKSKIQNQVKTLQDTSLQKSFKTTTTKEKLEVFATSFCKLFIKNQKNRRNKFEIWVKIFHDNMAPILNDLEAFYKSMPYPEFKRFNRKQMEESLNRLLFHVYEQTRRFDITNIKCKDLIGNELTKIMERKHLSKLNRSMGVFLQGVKELMEPYIEELESESKRQVSVNASVPQRSLSKSHISSFLQRNRTQDRQEETQEESIEAPSFGDDPSMTSKMPVAQLQDIYRQIARGTYVQPDIVGTMRQVQNMDRITANLTARVQQRALQKRDASLLRVRRDDRPLEGSLIERIAPSSLTAFTRIVGNNEHLATLDVSDETLRALDIVLEHCEDVDMKICAVLCASDRSKMRFDNPISQSIAKLVQQIRIVLYGNGNKMAKKINALYKLFDRIDSQRLLQRLGGVQFTQDECNRMLEKPFAVSTDEADAATKAVFEFIKDLRYLEQKCITNILQGDFYGDVEAIGTANATRGENVYLDTTSARNIVARLNTIKINHPVRVTSDMTEVPTNLLERDILYVACQLTHRNAFDNDSSDRDEEDELDATDHMDYVSKFALSIARSFQEGKLNEHDALRVIRQILFLLPCIPLNFFHTFIYHVDNEYFRAIRFEDPLLNAVVRSELLFKHNRMLCSGDRLMYRLEQNVLVSKVEAFMSIFDNDLVNLANTINEAERTRAKSHIAGQEIANNGNGVLALPDSVDVANALEGNYNNLQLGLVSENIPQGDVAHADIGTELKNIDDLLSKQSGAADHLDSSKIAKIARRYELQPSALKRKNYFQCRGSEPPNWFPGFYSVFSDSYLSRPVLYPSPFQMLAHAWRSMAPIVNR